MCRLLADQRTWDDAVQAEIDSLPIYRLGELLDEADVMMASPIDRNRAQGHLLRRQVMHALERMREAG